MFSVSGEYHTGFHVIRSNLNIRKRHEIKSDVTVNNDFLL